MKRTNDVFTTYEQEKKCNTNFYCKRRVLDDGVTTIPLDIYFKVLRQNTSSYDKIRHLDSVYKRLDFDEKFTNLICLTN